MALRLCTSYGHASFSPIQCTPKADIAGVIPEFAGPLATCAERWVTLPHVSQSMELNVLGPQSNLGTPLGLYVHEKHDILASTLSSGGFCFMLLVSDKVLLGYLREMGHINELSWFPMRVLWSNSWKIFIFFVLYKAALRAWWYCSKTSGSTDAKQWQRTVTLKIG